MAQRVCFKFMWIFTWTEKINNKKKEWISLTQSRGYTYTPGLRMRSKKQKKMMTMYLKMVIVIIIIICMFVCAVFFSVQIVTAKAIWICSCHCTTIAMQQCSPSESTFASVCLSACLAGWLATWTMYPSYSHISHFNTKHEDSATYEIFIATFDVWIDKKAVDLMLTLL